MVEDIKQAIKKTNLAYLWDKEGREYKLQKDSKATTHGACLKGEFISCLQGRVDLNQGTEGLLFVTDKLTYSEMVRSWDGDYPAVGADIIKHGAYYSFCTLVTLPTGDVVLADVFQETTHAPKVIGKVQ